MKNRGHGTRKKVAKCEKGTCLFLIICARPKYVNMPPPHDRGEGCFLALLCGFLVSVYVQKR